MTEGDKIRRHTLSIVSEPTRNDLRIKSYSTLILIPRTHRNSGLTERFLGITGVGSGTASSRTIASVVGGTSSSSSACCGGSGSRRSSILGSCSSCGSAGSTTLRYRQSFSQSRSKRISGMNLQLQHL